jgi:hypothetical protein
MPADLDGPVPSAKDPLNEFSDLGEDSGVLDAKRQTLRGSASLNELLDLLIEFAATRIQPHPSRDPS